MFNIVLHQPQIPPNTGNIARLCVATNSKLHIIRPIAFFLDDKTMRRAGCDYWEHLDLEIHDSLSDLYSKAGDTNFYYVSKFGKMRYSEIDYKDGDYLIFGSEQHGLPKEVLETNSDKTLFIPMSGPARSLNLSNSVAVVLYEAIRQICICK